MRRIVHIGAVVATTAAVSPALAAFGPAHTPADADPGDDGAQNAPLTVEAITPKSIGDDSTVRISGQVTNTTGSALDEIEVRFSYSSRPFRERSELDSFASGDGAAPETEAGGAELDTPLAPGESTEYTLSAEAADLDLSSWGVYPMAVEAVSGAGEDVGATRTFLPYRGGGSAPEPVDIAWVWPLVDSPQRAGDDTYLDSSLQESLRSEGRLGRLLAVGAQSDEVVLDPEAPGTQTPASPSQPQEPSPSTPSVPADDATDPPDAADDSAQGQDESGDASDVPVTWAVDPGTLADVERMTSAYEVADDPQAAVSTGTGSASPDMSTTSMEASAEAQLWLEQARGALAGDQVVSTPYASADIAALLRNGLGDDADAAVSLGRSTAERVLGRSTDATVALPQGGLMNQATREFFQGHGASTFLLRDDAMPAKPHVDHTATAEAPVSLGEGEQGTALVADSGLTEVLSTDASQPGEAALAQQRFAAESAMIAGEDPGGRRTVVAYPPSDWNPGAEYAQGLLESSASLPWLDPVNLADVAPDGSGAGEDRTTPTYPESGTESELSGSYLQPIKDLRGRVRLFNSVLVDDPDPFRPAVLRLESAAWRREDDLAGPARALVERAIERDMDKVRIIPTEPVTLASASGTIGIPLANDLEDHTVRVNLSMLPDNPERLNIGGYQDTIEIGPGEKTTVYVELSARVNGRTVVRMNLHNLSGEPVSDGQYLPVNATGMGMQALIISGIGALVLVVALAPRALRKWARDRKGGTAAGDTAAGDGASAEQADDSPEDGSEGVRADAPDEASAPASGVQDNEDDSASGPAVGSDSSEPSAEGGGDGEDRSDGTGTGR
ncbi:DUF6049 family protein [Streptomonospora salina]|uniref:Secreted protein n=1 Tax=Streptomonospora salina TaxID=104205 RepID=A0A841E4B7_9ACTN|nr:DUF6049 family protein [Streptomonospora salina]MBB5998697.1 hypothetical protein [Streptomonospora salina]